MPRLLSYIFLLSFSCAAITSIWAAEVDRVLNGLELYYDAETLGLKAEAERYLAQQDDGSYLLLNKINAAPLGVTLAELEESSQFKVFGQDLSPLHYRLRQKGLGAKEENVLFDWDSSQASNDFDDQTQNLSLKPGVTDKLLFQLILRQQLLNGNTGPFSFQLADEGKLETQRYELIGEEVLQTPLGSFNTVKLQRLRENDSKRATTFWLASDWDYLLIAIEQVDNRGRATTLKLREGKLAGEPIIGL